VVKNGWYFEESTQMYYKYYKGTKIRGVEARAWTELLKSKGLNPEDIEVLVES
jgi:hypothetical protein